MIREVIYDDDGEPLAATCVERPLSDEARAALAALARAARGRLPELTPDEIARQERSQERNRARLARFGIAVSPDDAAERAG